MGLAYSIVITDAAIAPAFPSNTARGGVLYPIVLSSRPGIGLYPEDPQGRRLGGYLMFSAMASLAISSALWMTATSANPIAIQVAKEYGVDVGFGKWLIASSVPAIIIIRALPWVPRRLRTRPEWARHRKRPPQPRGPWPNWQAQALPRRTHHGRCLHPDGLRLDLCR